MAGVAIGLGEHWGVAPWALRIAFILLSFAAGLGIVLYVLAWLLIPDEATGRAIVSSSSPGARWLGIGVGVLGILAVAGIDGFGGADLIFGIALLVIGVLIYQGNLFGPASSTQMAATVAPPIGDGTDIAAGSGSGGGAGSLLLPPPTLPPTPPPPPRPRSILGRLILAAVLIGLGVLALIDNFSTLVEPVFYHYIALGLLIVGVGLLIGSVWGRARWLIPIAIISLIPLAAIGGVVFATEGSDFEQNPTLLLRGRVSEGLRATPADVAEIASPYHVGVGDLLLDLRQVDFTGEEVEVTAGVDAGELIVLVPDDVALDVTAKAGTGEIDLFGETREGFGLNAEYARAGDAGQLQLNLVVNVGRIAVDNVWVVPFERR